MSALYQERVSLQRITTPSSCVNLQECRDNTNKDDDELADHWVIRQYWRMASGLK